VNMVTTPTVCLGRMCATGSHRNSTVFGRNSGTEQLHSSNTFDILCAPIAVSRTESIALLWRVVFSILT